MRAATLTTTILAVVAAVSTGCRPSTASIPPTAIPTAVYGENSGVTDAVRGSCPLTTRIPTVSWSSRSAVGGA